MSESKYEVILYWDKVDETFVADVPELPGCKAHGASKAEAVMNAEEAVALWLRAAAEDGETIPTPKGRLTFA